MESYGYVNGFWLNADGSQTYPYTAEWKYDGNGWWYQDTAGWYPVNQWLKIDGTWYFFDGTGYMVTNCYVGGCWIDANGAWNPYSAAGSWRSNAYGWWYGNTAGWYASNEWMKIDGSWYYFYGNGYMATNCYIGNYWVGANGVMW